jgi:hypothetical protein
MILSPTTKRLVRIAALTLIAASASLPLSAQVSVLTNKFDNNRDGLNASETLLTTANVNSNQFGKLYSYTLDGYVQAQPLYMYGLTLNGGVHNVVFVETLNNSVYAIDADANTLLWQVNLGTPVTAKAEGCSGVTGFNQIGIISTPVIDATTNTMYVTDKTYVSGVAAYWLHALDVTTGLDKFGGPVQIQGSVGGLTMSAMAEIQRPSLLESNGAIYIGFGSNGCDYGARGWFFAYSASTLQQLAEMTTQPDNTYGSSIWQGGVGPAADSAGNVYLSTANGEFNYSANDLGDTVLKLTQSGGAFTIEDYFTPFDQLNMAENDIDLGSAGPVILPPQTSPPAPAENMLVASGKDADIYLINMNDMGGYSTDGSNDNIVQYIPATLDGELHGAPLYWNNMIYFLAQQDYLRGYALTNGVLATTPTIQTGLKLTNQAFPVISANGKTNGIVWLVRNVSNVPLLSAYSATNLALIYDSGQATGGRDTLGIVGHGATATVANGKVFEGTQGLTAGDNYGQLVVYGLLPAVTIAGGNGQTASVGTALPVALTAATVNAYTQAPISGVNIAFSDGGKGGSFNPATATTNSSGLASTTYTLPTKPQTVSVTASSTGYGSATFTEVAQIGAVATIGLVSGSKQKGTVGSTLSAPIVVRAKDAYGNLEVGVPIQFSDGNVGGVFSQPNPVTTGSNGEASITYTLPLKAQTVTITAANGTASAKISETAAAGPAALLNLIQGNNQSAHVKNRLPKALIVTVTDQYGNGLPGLTVNFTDNGAGGTFSNSAPVTSASGQVSVSYITGTTSGSITIDASYGSLSPAVFSETVLTTPK